MTAKLRPEQRKLWRRIYLTTFEDGATVQEASQMADTAVAHWEERGAFEAESAPNALQTSTWDGFSLVVGRMLHDDATIEQLGALRAMYPVEFDFMRNKLVALSGAKPAELV